MSFPIGVNFDADEDLLDELRELCAKLKLIASRMGGAVSYVMGGMKTVR